MIQRIFSLNISSAHCYITVKLPIRHETPINQSIIFIVMLFKWLSSSEESQVQFKSSYNITNRHLEAGTYILLKTYIYVRTLRSNNMLRRQSSFRFLQLCRKNVVWITWRNISLPRSLLPKIGRNFIFRKTVVSNDSLILYCMIYIAHNLLIHIMKVRLQNFGILLF